MIDADFFRHGIGGGRRHGHAILIDAKAPLRVSEVVRRHGFERPARLHQTFDMMMEAQAAGITARHAGRRPAQMPVGAEYHPVRGQTGEGFIVFQQLPHVMAGQRQHEFININEGQPAAAVLPRAQAVKIG